MSQDKILDSGKRDKIPQYEVPQDIIPDSGKRDKIPHSKIKLHNNKITIFYDNNLFHSSK